MLQNYFKEITFLPSLVGSSLIFLFSKFSEYMVPGFKKLRMIASAATSLCG